METFLGIMIPFLGTTLGAACVFFMKRSLGDLVQRSLAGFAAGVMVAASIWSLLIPAIEQSEDMGKLSFLPAFIGFWIGVLFLLLLDRLIPHLHVGSEQAEGPKSKLGRTTMMVLAVTRDNLALAYLKIYPISTELFSKNEKRLIAKQLTVSLSSAQYPFQLLAVSRPVDISPLLSELSATLTSSSDVKQKELLKQEIVEMGAFALSGEVVERQFYIKIWDRVSDGVERDLLQKLKLLGGYFSDSGIQTEILQQQDIVRLCNLVNNPAYVHLEDSGINAAIPILESVGVV